MNNLINSARKNVNVLGEEELTKVVGGWGGPWRRSGGGRRQQGGGGGGGAMRKRDHGGNGRNGRQNDHDKGEVNVVIFKITVIDLSDVVAGD